MVMDLESHDDGISAPQEQHLPQEQDEGRSLTTSAAPPSSAPRPQPSSPRLSAYLSNMHLSPRDRAFSEPREPPHSCSSAPRIRRSGLLRSRSDSPAPEFPDPYLHPLFAEEPEDHSGWACFSRPEYDLTGKLPDTLRRMPEVRVRTNSDAPSFL